MQQVNQVIRWIVSTCGQKWRWVYPGKPVGITLPTEPGSGGYPEKLRITGGYPDIPEYSSIVKPARKPRELLFSLNLASEVKSLNPEKSYTR